MLSRRQAIAGIAAITSGCLSDRRQAWLLCAATTSDGQHTATMVSKSADIRFSQGLAERAHDVLVAPDRRSAVVFARRPGRSIYQLDLSNGRIVNSTQTTNDRHLYGHGLFTRDGKHVLTSENNIASGAGVIVVRDAQSLAVEHEFQSFGIGPHEIRWADDGRTVIVANGGIATHPDYGREPLNLDTMAPNIARIDAASGKLLAIAMPSHSKNSIRHFDVLADGSALIGMQQQDGYSGAQPVVAASRPAQPTLQALRIDSGNLLALNRYTASVSANPRSGHAVVTSPRGNRVSFWKTSKQAYAGSIRLPDVAGACFDQYASEFVVSSGRGVLYRFDASTFALKSELSQRVPDISFDNHLCITHI
ncbi:MAG: DUF1513 domain-containing protein [Pseudomonadota bacterium]